MKQDTHLQKGRLKTYFGSLDCGSRGRAKGDRVVENVIAGDALAADD